MTHAKQINVLCRFSTAFGCIAYLLSSCFLPGVASAGYKYSSDDLIVNINTQTTVVPILNLLNGASYEFYYHNNGAVCSTPHISITVSPFYFRGSGSADLTKGTSQAFVRVLTGVTAEVSECFFNTVSAGITCDSNIIPLVGNALSGEMSVRPLCALELDGVPVMFFFTQMTSPYPIVLPRDYSVTLPAPLTTNGLSIEISFGKYENDVFRVLDPPFDKTRRFPMSARGVFATSPFPDIHDPSNYTIPGSNLILAGTLRPDEFSNAGTPEEARSNLFPWSSIFISDPYAIGFVRVRDSLIAPRTAAKPTDPRYGVLGGLFPLEIKATLKSDKLESPIKVRLVLGSLTVKFDADGTGSPVVSAALSVDSLEVVNGDNGTAIPASIHPSIVLNGPRITYNGQLRVDIQNLNLDVATTGSTTTVVPLGDALREIINNALPSLADIHLKTTVELPQCIGASDTKSRIDAVSACSSYGNATAGFMSRASSAKTISLAIDPARTTITTETGEIDLNLVRPHE